MRWEKLRRETGLIEHVCEHGIGHPSQGSALWQAEGRDPDKADLEGNHSYWLVHGCDGCCGRDDFPGTWFHSMRAAHRIIRDLLKERAENRSKRNGPTD